jgi:hypothetical protein
MDGLQQCPSEASITPSVYWRRVAGRYFREAARHPGVPEIKHAAVVTGTIARMHEAGQVELADAIELQVIKDQLLADERIADIAGKQAEHQARLCELRRRAIEKKLGHPLPERTVVEARVRAEVVHQLAVRRPTDQKLAPRRTCTRRRRPGARRVARRATADGDGSGSTGEGSHEGRLVSTDRPIGRSFCVGRWSI